jgi:hypothetical protein
MKSINERLDCILASDAPKILAGTFNDVSELTDEQLKHFRTAEYLYSLSPIITDGIHRGMHLGVLLDDTLTYVHMVVVSKRFIDQTSDSPVFNQI